MARYPYGRSRPGELLLRIRTERVAQLLERLLLCNTIPFLKTQLVAKKTCLGKKEVGDTCTMRSNVSWVMVIWDPLDRQTDTHD